MLRPERLKNGLRGKLHGHEAQLYKRANMIFQQAVINLIDVGKIIDGISLRILIVHSDFIMKNRMKPNISESRGVLDLAEIQPSLPETAPALADHRLD